MAKKLNINIGEKVKYCEHCGKYYSNHLSTCPYCGGAKHEVKQVTPEIEKEIGE